MLDYWAKIEFSSILGRIGNFLVEISFLWVKTWLIQYQAADTNFQFIQRVSHVKSTT